MSKPDVPNSKTDNKEQEESWKELIIAGGAALATAVLSLVLVVVLEKGAGISDGARVIPILLVPVLVFGIVSGGLSGVTAPGGWRLSFRRLTKMALKNREQLREAEAKLKEQQDMINKLVIFSMSPGVLHHLLGITILKNYIYRQNYEVKDGKDDKGEHAVGDLWQREFYHLKDHGLIGPRTQEFVPKMHGTNIAGFVKPTNVGLDYLKLRLKLRKADILEDDEFKEWLDPDILDKDGNKIRDNLNIEGIESIGLKVNASNLVVMA
jgi:hypothetical protein